MKYILIIVFFVYAVYAKPITPIPQSVHVNLKKAKLGKELFFDTLVSADGTISCASCHNIQKGGDDGLRFSFGIKGQEGNINAPTVLNAVYNFRQFWNGSAKDLAQQAEGPIQNPIEMGNDFKNLIKTLKNSKYKKEFDDIYHNGVTKENIVDSIAEYEKTLITPNSPFDRYLRGDKSAITQKQKEGYEIFKEKGCIACHNGINIGGNLYNKFGVFEDAKSLRLGRYEVTHKEQDKYYFKVPSLRNVALTAPYLHDGRYENLRDVVKFMARYQLGKVVTQDEINKIVLFLNSLTAKPLKIDLR